VLLALLSLKKVLAAALHISINGMELKTSLLAPSVAYPAAAAPFTGPKILQLSPLPGNFYKRDHFYYSPFTDITQGDFVAIITYATQ
jgi:hypothetical protein